MQEILEGMSLLLPPEAGAIRRMEAGLAAMLENLGFEEVRLPVITSPGPNDNGESSAGPIKLALPGGMIGRLCSDMTEPCARLAVRELAMKKRPLRLFYTGPVFREPSSRGSIAVSRQEMQLGAEIYGHDGLKAGLEAIGAAIGICRFAEEPVQFRIGDIALLNELIDASAIGPDAGISLKAALISHDISTAMAVLKSSGKRNTALRALRQLIPANPAEVAMEALTGLAAEYPEIKLAEEAGRASMLLDGARMVAKGVDIAFELGLLRPLNYYTGPVFEAYVNGYGKPLLGGGQYDGLMKALGSDEGGIGFALDLGMLMEISSSKAGCAR